MLGTELAHRRARCRGTPSPHGRGSPLRASRRERVLAQHSAQRRGEGLSRASRPNCAPELCKELDSVRPIDWVVLLATLFAIVAYGVWKGRKQDCLDSYLLAGRSLQWPTIALSIMATQASAITFLSTPGQ